MTHLARLVQRGDTQPFDTALANLPVATKFRKPSMIGGTLLRGYAAMRVGLRAVGKATKSMDGEPQGVPSQQFRTCAAR